MDKTYHLVQLHKGQLTIRKVQSAPLNQLLMSGSSEQPNIRPIVSMIVCDLALEELKKLYTYKE